MLQLLCMGQTRVTAPLYGTNYVYVGIKTGENNAYHAFLSAVLNMN